MRGSVQGGIRLRARTSEEMNVCMRVRLTSSGADAGAFQNVFELILKILRATVIVVRAYT